MKHRYEVAPLFNSPAPPPKRRPTAPVSTSVRYSRIRPARRTLCDDCCADIHELGQALAPYPRRALWMRRTGGDRPARLCQSHKDKRCEDESR
jgi:hypothetical protein